MNKAAAIGEQNLYIFLSSESAKTGKLVIITSKGNGKGRQSVFKCRTLLHYICVYYYNFDL